MSSSAIHAGGSMTARTRDAVRKQIEADMWEVDAALKAVRPACEPGKARRLLARRRTLRAEMEVEMLLAGA
jgi:hypothetical protein